MSGEPSPVQSAPGLQIKFGKFEITIGGGVLTVILYMVGRKFGLLP